jgi:acetyl-CoA acetyltransferase
MSSAFEGARIVGAGQTVYAKKSPHTVQKLIYDAGRAALHDAGLRWAQVDGLAITSFMLPPDNVSTVAEHLGIEARFLFQGLYGGASGIIGMAHAARAIRDGACDVVVVAAADAFDVASHNETLDRFNGSVREFMSPQGFGGANGMFALHTRLYMERNGATREDFGRFCIGLRTNALLNPNALFKVPLTMADYLGAKQIADPLRLYDCVLPCVGGDAIVLVSERVAQTLPGPTVRILASEEIHNYPANDAYSVPGGWEGFADRLYDRARQVKCQRGVVLGYGMVAYGRGLCSSAAVLERVE